MSLSDKDKQIWQSYVKDVTPLHHDLVKPDVVPRIKKQPEDVCRVNGLMDLHGLTLQQAHVSVHEQLNAHHNTLRYMTVVTGKSGQMSKEFPHWLENHAHVHRLESLNDGGAFRIWFKKTRHKQK